MVIVLIMSALICGGWALLSLMSRIVKLELNNEALAFQVGKLKLVNEALISKIDKLEIAHDALNATITQDRKDIEKDIDALNSNAESSESAHAAMTAKLDTLERNFTQAQGAANAAKRAAGECVNPLPGSDVIGSFVDPATMNRGTSALEFGCHQGRTYQNPAFPDITYDVPDWVGRVTHHAQTDASSAIQAFSSFSQWLQAMASSSGWDIGFANLFSIGSSTEAQKVGNVQRAL